MSPASPADAPGTWAPVPAGSPFGAAALPYGVFSGGRDARDAARRPGVRVGDQVLDLAGLARALPPPVPAPLLSAAALNPLLAAGPPAWSAVRGWLQDLLGDEGFAPMVRPWLRPLAEVRLHLPFVVADLVDFYSSEHHAANVGRMLRPDAEPLPRNWKHLPAGYHGRAGTVVVSGTDVVRPRGQRVEPGAPAPTVGPTRRLDVEAEVGFVVGVGSALGEPVPASALADHVFGVCLVNDWSARDLQAWEYVPLGPFLAKSFATTVSAWVLPLAALGSARVPPPPRDVPLPDYLADDPDQPWGLDVELELACNATVLSRPPLRSHYWTAAQQLAHLTVAGASLRTGDLFASGTVSGPRPDQRGSLLELTWNGTRPVRLADGSTRDFLADGDEVRITATAPGPGGSRVGLGEVTGRVQPAREPAS